MSTEGAGGDPRRGQREHEGIRRNVREHGDCTVGAHRLPTAPGGVAGPRLEPWWNERKNEAPSHGVSLFPLSTPSLRSSEMNKPYQGVAQQLNADRV
jgi:hypothetical protein